MLQVLGAIDTPAATVYTDDKDELLVYVLPKRASLRREADGKAAFKFVEYRSLRPLPNGRNGAGLVVMDIELALSGSEEAALRQQLADQINARRGPNNPNPVQPMHFTLSKPQVTDATVTVDILSNSTNLVQRVNNGGKPSMYGNNVVALSAELTQEGAPIFAATMQSQGLGGVRIEYAMTFAGRMPPVTATGTWHASKFYSFVQDVDFEENFWSEDDFSEKVSEVFLNSESRVVEVDPGALPNTDPDVRKMLDTLEASVTRELEDAVKRNLLEAIPPENRDFAKVRDDDFENIHRSVTTNKVADVFIQHKENQVAAIHVQPQNNMASLVSQGFAWKDYAITADVDEPFFRQLNLSIQVNAEFDKLPIFSVDVFIDYPPATASGGIKTFSFNSTDDIHRFDAFTNGGPTAFKYKYVVHYTGESRTLDSGWKDFDGNDLKVDVDDLGLWLVDIEVGDVNWEQVTRAVLTLEHPEVSPGVPPIARFQIDKDSKDQHVKELLMQPAQAYGGEVKFFMKDGREFTRTLAGLKGQRFYVDDPFSVDYDVALRTRGDFETVIDTIFVDLTYTDPVNDYRQTANFALSKDSRFVDWAFPVVDENAGSVTYRAITTYKDGHSDDSGEIPLTGRTLMLGIESSTVDVTIVPDLIPWDQVKLASVDLHYVDPANAIDEHKSVTLRSGAAEQVLSLSIRDIGLKTYEWTVTFFLQDGTKRTSSSAGRVSDDKLFVELPTA